MPPHENTGILSSVRPKRRYCMAPFMPLAQFRGNPGALTAVRIYGNADAKVGVAGCKASRRTAGSVLKRTRVRERVELAWPRKLAPGKDESISGLVRRNRASSR